MRVVAYDPYVTLERFRELGVESAPTLEVVYAKSDLITLHLPLNEQTTGLLTPLHSTACETGCGS